MGVHTTNSTMKNVISKSPMEKSKHITDHLVRKTLVKRLKQNNVAKSEIISITGHSTEEGLDTYDSGDKQHQAISNAIDDCRIKPFSHRQHFIPPNDPRNLNPTFSFFQQADFQQNTLPLYAQLILVPQQCLSVSKSTNYEYNSSREKLNLSRNVVE